MAGLPPSTLSIQNPTGKLADGTPFFDLTALAGGDSVCSRVKRRPQGSSVSTTRAPRVHRSEPLSWPLPAATPARPGAARWRTPTSPCRPLRSMSGPRSRSRSDGSPGGLSDWVGLYPAGALTSTTLIGSTSTARRSGRASPPRVAPSSSRPVGLGTVPVPAVCRQLLRTSRHERGPHRGGRRRRSRRRRRRSRGSARTPVSRARTA